MCDLCKHAQPRWPDRCSKSRIGTKRLMPLFGYTGFGNMQSRLNDDQTINIRGTEGGYFTDLATGEIIDHWDNPWTGETVEVFPFINKTNG